MRIRSGLKNFILHLLLVVLIAAACNNSSVPVQKNVTDQDQTMSLTLDAPSFSRSVDFWTEQVSEKHASASFTNIARNIRTGISCRSGVLFLLSALTSLSVFSRFNEKRIAFCDSRFVHRNSFTISFMHDEDGRKRISYV